MTGPSYRAILRVEKASASEEIQMRFSTTVFLPSAEEVDIMGDAVFAAAKRSTRSGRFSAEGGVGGRVCVCETLGSEELKEALLFAKREKALALIVTEEPNRTVAVPTILISRDQLNSIKDELKGAFVSVTYTSGSYETHPVTFVLQDTLEEGGCLEWDGTIRVPANTSDHRDIDHAFVSEPLIFRNRQGDIVKFTSKDGMSMAGRICLVGDCISDDDFAQIVRLAAQHGAKALFTTYEKPPLRHIPLPVVVVEEKRFRRMKKLGTMVFFTYKSDARRNVEPRPRATLPLPAEKSYAAALKSSPKNPPRPPSSSEKKNSSSWGMGFLGDAVTYVGRTFRIIYDPQSKKRFEAIVANGTSWSKDVHLYHEALELLVWICSVEEPQNRQSELETLSEAIDEMMSGNSGVGDVMMANFFAKLHPLLSREASLQLMKNAVNLIKNITIDESDAISSSFDLDTTDLDGYVVDMVKYLSTQSSNKGSMKGFVLSALWIRAHHCQSVKKGYWSHLRAIATHTLFMEEQETLLSFMSLSQFNTLAVCTATSFPDICDFFSGEDKVSVLSAAFLGLLRLYRSDFTNRIDWQRKFGSIRNVTAISLLDRFEIENAGSDISRAETNFINAIVQNIESKSTQAFSDFGCVYDCLRVDSRLFDIATELMVKSICSSLEDWRDVPSPESVSGLLRMDIGRHLLSGRMGFYALKSYLDSLFKRYFGPDEEKLVLLGQLFSFFACGDCTDEEAASVVLNAIRISISTSRDLFKLCLTAMDVSQHFQDIFYDVDKSSLAARVGEAFIRDTGICSTIRASPNKLRIVISRLENRPDGRLSHFLYQHLVRGLKDECKIIDSAISFYESVWEGFISQSLDARNIVHEIIINSFEIWNPSSIIDLLKLEAPLLKAIHDILLSISTEENCEAVHQKKSGACLESLSSVADMWREKFEKERCNVVELQQAEGYCTDDKQEVLSTILGSHFPSSSDIDEKVAEMEKLVEDVRSSLYFCITKDDDLFKLSIKDLATHYRIKIDTPMSHLISKYLSGGDPNIDLSSIRREAKYIFDFVNKNRRELQAAAHFHFFRSTLFQHEVGVWAEIYFDDFFSKVSASLRRLELLLSPTATFASVSEAASVLVRDRVDFDDEMTAIMSFHVVDDERLRTGLKDVMTLATLAEQLSNFVESCKTFKFAFAECDDSFIELGGICNQMNCNEGCDWNVAQCLQIGKRIVEILLPRPSMFADLGEGLRYYKPLIDFFAELRHCSSVLDLAREKSWFGKKGLSTFYQEFENVTNVLNQKQSYEMEVLNRLEPTIQCISAVGGNLQCDRVATLLEILNANDYFSHQNIAAMRMIQENICKIQDWLSEGMDDIAAIHSKFALIQSSGRIVISSEDSVDEAATPKRALSLYFSRSDASEVIMDESEVRELVQHLGFSTHESDETRMNVEKFVRVYEQCGQVMASQQMMADVGFGGDEARKRLEFSLDEDSEDLALRWLEEADKLTEECNNWLASIRSKNRPSLLFWKDELRFIFLCMCDIRSKGEDEGSLEWRLLMSILSQMPLKPDCSSLITDFASAASRGSWLEDVSIFVSECGNQDRVTSDLGGSNVIIHKVDCLDNTIFAAQLKLMHQIYKNRCPSSFEYLDGSCIKSSDHVAMFLERVRAFPEHIFVISYVERLAASEQELVATFIAQHARSADTMHLHCIQSKDTVLYASPGVSISSWNDSSLNEYCPSQWLRSCVAAKGHVRDISVVFSDTSGSGKTKFIRSELEKANANGAQVASLYIHEDFSLTKAVGQLRNKFGGGGSEAKSIHFGLSCDDEPSDEFLLSVNHFFNSFLLFGNVYDPTSGDSFYGSSHKWNVFVEMNAQVAGEEAAKAWLSERIPILSHCSLRIVQPPSDFSIDEKARRVATYLRAYDNGTIDRKFNSTPAQKTILFVLDKSGSMCSTVGGRSRFQVASESMLSVFDSHIRVMDSVGVVLFDHAVDEAVPCQRIANDQDLNCVRREIANLTIGPDGGTSMYTALRTVLDSVSESTRGQDEDVWVVCLTDGESADRPSLIREQLSNSPDNLHVILIGVGLRESYHQAMRDLCNKYHDVDRPSNKGIFLPAADNIDDIESAFDEVASRIPVSQTFELDGAMTDEQCRDWLDRYRPHFISPENKLAYSFWISFIYRRVSVFDASEDFNYNETYDSLGSSLMEVMLDESEKMLMRDQTDRSWSQSKHTQLIYDFSQPESPKFRLICTSPDDLDPTQREKFEQLDLPGFAIPNTMELRQRETLDRYLSQALSIPLTEDQKGNQYLQCVNDHKFVLTLDFTLKLLNIHEHVSCGAPCIMEGETGVSKTALTKMYSILVNSQQLQIASASTMDTLESTLQELMTVFPGVPLGNEECILDRIFTFLEISPQHTSADVYRAVTKISGEISVASSKRSALFLDMPSFIVPTDGDVDVLARTKEMLTCFSQSYLEQLFFDINIDASMTAEDINEKFSEAKRVARKVAGLDTKVVIFLDEINTASVLGLIKEIIVDRSLNGEPLEENIVIVAACNPVRKSSLSQVTANRVSDLGREWVSGHYQVRQLPPSLSKICWDYGALKREQEKEFIQQRIMMMDQNLSISLTSKMTEILSSSHEFIRELARDHIVTYSSSAGMDESEAFLRARSVVSLRDIQRVFHLTNYFLNHFSLEGPNSDNNATHPFRRAMLVSVAIVYYLRLDAAARKIFVQKVNNLPTEQDEECSLLDALGSAMDKVVEETEIPEGISLTLGLKENIFVTLVCTLSRVPLMIIGPPGCSKTLAVSIVNDNANGEESPSQYYRDLARIQPFHYQCSKTSTSNEVASLFSRAEQRQKTVDRARQQCLVFMDEAGLPEEERESLKVLHYLLEGHMSSCPNVAFVCITNHILDAAKSNRCACLLRPEPDMEELSCISRGILCQKLQEDSNSVELVCFGEQVVEMKEFSDRMCSCYVDLMKDTERFSFFVDFFGLRDFIHFLKFLRRTAPPVKDSILRIPEEVFVNALERNFNGIDKDKFANICAFFLAKGLASCDQIRLLLEKYIRDPMEVIHNALSEQPTNDISRYNLPRYKMIIDHTNDDSITRLLQISGILNSSHAFYKLSGIDEGAEVEKLNLVSRVKYAAQYGKKTVVLSQVEGVSECFYDLFNQHFKEFRKEDGEVSYFANIAFGGVSRPCLVNPSFQCIVHVQSSELANLPAPFLNRFEKFLLNVDDILRYKLKQLPAGLRDILSQSLKDSRDFVQSIGGKSVWSRSVEDTLKSIYISLIRPEVCSGNDRLETGMSGESITLNVLSFIASNFDVSVTVDDIHSCIESAKVEYSGFKDGVELERVIACINMGKATLPFEDILNGCLHTPLSRVLKQIILSSITRCAVIRLLQLVRPDALYLRRRAVPDEILRIYFGEQEHFSLKRLIGKLCGRNKTNQFHMIFARSDSCAHSLPSWSNIDGIDPSILHRVRSLVHDDPSTVEIHHLDLLKCESEIRTTFDSWVSKVDVNTFILVVDMKMQSANIVNFIRSYVEQATLTTDKHFILLLHFPLSCDQSIYPALFLGKWSCIFLDGIGDADGNNVDFNNVLQNACSLTGQELNADNLLAALKPKALQYVASQVPFYSCSKQPDSVNQAMTLTARMDCLERILASLVGQVTLETTLCRKFIVMWTNERIREIVYRSAFALASGNSKLSFSSALTSTLQSSFNKFLAKSLFEINVWSNLDVLDPSFADDETDKIFALVLNGLPLPGVPLEELLLIRDMSLRLQPLPMEMKSQEASTVFPFFFQISSLIEMAIDNSNFDFLDESSLDQNDDFSPLFVERVGTLLGEIADSMEIAGVVRDIIAYVADSERLFSRYLQHILGWRYGCRNLDQVAKWVTLKMDAASMLDGSLHCNILYLHILCRKNVGSILRIASWDSECIAEDLLQNGVQFEGINFVSTMVSHFLQLLSENFEMKKWSNSCSVFLQSLSALMEGSVIEGEDLLVKLRLLIIVNVLIKGDVADEREVLRIVQSVTEAEDDTSKDITTVSGCLDLIQDFNDETTPEKLKDAQNQLLRVFFSPWWLKIIPGKVHNDDAIFLVRAIKQRHDHINEQVAMGHLRNLLTSRRGHGSQAVLPTSSFLPSIVILLSSELNAAHNESFSESGDRVGMPHFVPHWLLAECVSTMPSAVGLIDEVGWYLRNYRNSFDDCPLAKIIFVIIFGELLEKARSINSNDLLIMFQASVQEQKEVNQATNARLLRSSGEVSLQGPLSIKGCYVRALETDAILLTFVCKVAEELSISSRACALEGVNANSAVRTLNGIMPQFRWSDLFFKVIMSLKGDGHLATLLSEGGPLHNFEWCQQWMQGLSSHQEDIQIRLRRAETALREAEIEEENKVRQFRRCPHCNEMFGVDQENCGEFRCGRDAHGINNGPAVGGRAVQGGYGCGRQFRLGAALPYTRDEALLEPLREELRENRNLFEASNRGAELWTRAESLVIPPVSFHLRSEDESSMSSKIFNVSLVDHLSQSNERDNIGRLADILGQLPKLEHVSCLPDLIEFYVFIHKTFRHVVTREESFNMKLQDVMNERLLRARFGLAHASHLHNLWLRVVEKVNSFISANGSVTFECENVVVPFSDLRDVSLVQVLSEAEHPGNGHDSLFLVISDLLMRYNNFIISVSSFRDTRSVNNDQTEEIHPRSLVRGSKSSVEVKAVTEDVAETVANLIESFWEEGSFELEGLLEAIQRELDIIGSLQTVMSPLRFLRERFVFRDCSTSQNEMEESVQCFFSSNKQLYFAQREDWMLYEDVRDKAVQKWSGGQDCSCGIRHKMIVTFQGFSHGEWTSLLEGMRNTLDGLDFSKAQEFGEAIRLLGIDSLQSVGFPEMDGTGAALVNTLNKDEIVEFIDVCGEQLAAEAYTYNRLPSRLSEPISADSRECLESNINQLLQSKSNNDVYNEIQAFCEDVLSFYEPHIVTVSEQSNEPVVTYLQRNNAWDNTDGICTALPSNLGIRNYIDIRKVFHQLKLRLRQTEDGGNKSDTDVPPDVDTPYSNAWKWVARPSRNAGAEEEIRQGIFDRLWFEEAIKPRDVDVSPNTIEEEANKVVSGDNQDAVTSDDGGVEDADDIMPDLEEGEQDNQDAVTSDDGGVEDADDIMPDLEEGEQQTESKPFEEEKEEEEEEEVAAEVVSDSIEADNIEEDDSDVNAALSEHVATENETASMIDPEAVEAPIEVKGKQRQMTVVAAVAFAVIFTALVYALYRYLAFVNEDGVAEAESNETWECKDDVMAELTAEEESNECIG